MAIIHAVTQWQPYLLGCHFYIKIDHHSLKYFLEQWLSSLEQQKWITKLLGYDYKISYKKGKENALQFLIGQAMEKTRGQGKPDKLKTLFKKELS